MRRAAPFLGGKGFAGIQCCPLNMARPLCGCRYNVTGATDVTMLSSQTENPYWNQGVQGTPACDAIGVSVERSTRINLLGVVWCSWFCSKSCQIQSVSL